MIRLPISAFVFKGFISFAALLLIIPVFICLPGNLSGADTSTPSPPAERNYESTDNIETIESLPSVSKPPIIVEPSRTHEHEPYNFPIEEEVLEKESPEDHFFGQFMKMLGTLGLLVAIMIAASWSLKRMLNTRVQSLNDTSRIKVVETRALSNKSSVHLVEVEGKTYFIGESVNSVTLLDTLLDHPME